jgi:hypothetical protein
MRDTDTDERYARLRASVSTLYPELGRQELVTGTLGLMRSIDEQAREERSERARRGWERRRGT